MGCLKLDTKHNFPLKVVYSKQVQTTEENLYLHRDYQQTILAITNAYQKIVEQRRFDAWEGGALKNHPVDDFSERASIERWGEQVRHYNVTTGAFTTDKLLTTLDRGYTGHEHLQSVGLINMNGRVYDPLLRRFLGPDNFVQDPFNTQNFNRFGYVLNNPLMYTDPSGEFLTWSFSRGGFSIGLNFSAIGIPLGFGINIGWSGGFSVGAYGEAGLRFGGTGFGFGAAVSVSYGYNFGTSTFSVTVGANISASLGPLFVGGGINTSFANGQFINSWGASVGLGIGNEKGSLGISAGYGSGGFTYGLNGSYNTPGARQMIKKYEQEQQQKRIEQTQLSKPLQELLAKSGATFDSSNTNEMSYPLFGGAEESGASNTPWMSFAESQLGQGEMNPGNNAAIIAYHATTGGFRNDETPWCSSFVNWSLTKAGISGTNSARAYSWKTWGQSLTKPAYGAIAVMDYSHVGFVAGVNSDGRLILLGGNQGRPGAVNLSPNSFNSVMTYRYPTGYTPNYNLPNYNLKGRSLNLNSTR